jgi:dATP pyrophosphohydrolase
MARAPFQVLVFPYRKIAGGKFEYAVFRRSDTDLWQGIAGGGEDYETPLHAAVRETSEEAGLVFPPTAFLKLQSVCSVPVIYFPHGKLWGRDTFVIPEHSFGVDATGKTILLSQEHREYQWVSPHTARAMLQFDSNKSAIWELNQRLRGLGPSEMGR